MLLLVLLLASPGILEPYLGHPFTAEQIMKMSTKEIHHRVSTMDLIKSGHPGIVVWNYISITVVSVVIRFKCA